MNTPRTRQLIEFLKVIDEFSTIKRTILHKNNQPESDPEHVWHLAMMILLLAPEIAPEADRERMLELVLIHDLPEIYAGDTWRFDEEGQKTKAEREQKAAKKLFAQLPDDLQDLFHQRLDEYKKKETIESRIVDSFDKLQPIIVNLASGGLSWKKDNISLEKLTANKRHVMEHNTKILELFELLLSQRKELESSSN